MLAAVGVIGSFRPPSVAVDDRELPPIPELVEPVPERFEAWEPFVIAWQVAGSAAEAPELSAFDAGFGQAPCAPLGVDDCRVRLAWDGVSRWSLTSSADESFDRADPRQLSTGGLFYGVEDGLLLGVLDTDRLPGLHVCHELAERRSAGEDVVAAAGAADVFVLRRPGWGAASCLGPHGIPVTFDRLGTEWSVISLERRPPTDDEIGAHLVAGRAAYAPEPGCADLSGRVPGWLAEAAARTGHRATFAGGGLEFEVPGAWGRRGCAWVTPAYLPVGARTHLLPHGRVVDELLHPLPVVSTELAGQRLWIAFIDAGATARGSRERDVFVLGEALSRLAGAVTVPIQAGTPAWTT